MPSASVAAGAPVAFSAVGSLHPFRKYVGSDIPSPDSAWPATSPGVYTDIPRSSQTSESTPC
jgi:hypothetical protein